MSDGGFLDDGDRALVNGLSELARCNPFLPERIHHERALLGDAFEEVSVVWSKRFDRGNPNVSKLAELGNAVARRLRARLRAGAVPTSAEVGLYQELVFFLLYGKHEDDYERAMASPEAPFYDEFVSEARFFLRALPEARHKEVERELPHWFAFLYQVRRASLHIFDYIVGASLPAARLRGSVWQSIFTHDLRRYRRSLYGKMHDIPTLVTGPSGTGKELVAQAIALAGFISFHPRSKRFDVELSQTFFPLNLSAFASNLIESELFGHRQGAFTGALSDRKGWLAVCPAPGAVFLDEIGELDPSIQVKLLRVLQTREFQPLGETRYHRFEGKIVAATNRDLAEEMREGRFREDLYYRLCADQISTPSLREQLADSSEDLPELVLFIAQRVVGPEEAETVTKEVSDWIGKNLGSDYPWPGNVRELEQCLRNVVIRREYQPWAPAGPEDSGTTLDLSRTKLTADELLDLFCSVAYRSSGSYVAAARRLGLDRRTVKSRAEACEERQRRARDP